LKCACPCKREFTPRWKNQIYYNSECRKRDKNRRWPVKRHCLLPVASQNDPERRRKALQLSVTPSLGGRYSTGQATNAPVGSRGQIRAWVCERSVAVGFESLRDGGIPLSINRREAVRREVEARLAKLGLLAKIYFDDFILPEPDLLTSHEVARFLRVSRDTLRGWRRAGDGPPFL